MPRKTIAPPPVDDVIVPVVKTTKPAAPRRKAAPKTIVETPNTSIANLAGAMESPCVFDAHQIEERAYQSWVERGCPMGSPQEDWYRAERELISRFATASK